MRTDVVVIGAGQSGLAMSWWLAHRSIPHAVLERGEVANTWHTERWDSLRLLTPNWQSRLPGFGYEGDDPDGYRSMPETVAFLRRYAVTIAAPVRTHCTVSSVRASSDGFEVLTDQGMWHCKAVVIATGAFNQAVVPAVAEQVPAAIKTLTAMQYKNPAQLEDGGVLVVGASASGAQIAHEIQRAGRPVTLAVGEHVRVPRRYRGKDILWWMDASGILDERYDQVDDIVRARNVASFQLAGYADRRTIDLNALTAIGVKLTGRLAGINDGKAQFSGSLRNVCALADLKMNRLLNSIDEWASTHGFDGEGERFPSTEIEESPPLLADFARKGIKTILWATGFRPDYSWLKVPVLDRKGHILHEGGVVTGAPGLYLLGTPFLRRRKSSLMDGAADDARELSEHLHDFLGGTTTHMPHAIAASSY